MQNTKKQTKSINYQYPSHNQSVHSSINIINSNQNSNIQSNKQCIPQGNSIKNSEYKNDSQQKKSSINESNKPSNSKLMVKSSLKASINKTTPQVIKSLNDKAKISDNSGNNYYVVNNKEKDKEEIKKSVNKKYKDIIKESMAQEVKPQDKTIGDRFRSVVQLTKAGKNQNGQQKTNQDIPLIHVNTGSISGFNLFAVLDGHGPYGHFISQFCRNYFIKKMTDYANLCKKKI